MAVGTSLRGAERRSNPDCFYGSHLDCFASLAMTVGLIKDATRLAAFSPKPPPRRRAPTSRASFARLGPHKGEG
jgi:hypothetical protein